MLTLLFTVLMVLCTVCMRSKMARAADAIDTTIQQQIAAGVEAGKRSVKIKPGIYKVKPGKPNQPHITLFNVNDIEIDARGVTLLCNNPSTSMDILNCKNVVLRGLTIDYDPLPFTQGTIVGFATDRTWTDVRIHKGYQPPFEYDSTKTNEKQAFLWCYDRVTRLLKAGALNRFVEKIVPQGDNVYRLDHGTTQFKDQAAVGDYIRIPQPFERPTGINIINCENITMLDVTLHSAPTHFGIASRFCSGLTFRRVRVIPGPMPEGATEARLCSTVGDGLNFSGITGKLLIEDCELNSTGDDGIAVYSEEGIVLKSDGDNQITVSFSTPGSRPLLEGSRMRLKTRPLGTSQQVTVVSCTVSVMPRAEIDTLRMKAVKAPYGDVMLGSAFDLKIDRPVRVRVGDMVMQFGADNPQYVIRGNRVTNAGSRGIVVNQSFGLVENNRVSHTYLPGIHLFTDFRSHGYSGPQEGIIIRNNQLSDTCSLWPGQDGWLGAINVSNWEGDAKGFGGHSDGGYRNIRIENNQITHAWGVNIQIQNASQITIANNRFSHSHKLKATKGAPRQVDGGALIYLEDVQDINISGNTVTAPGPYINQNPLTCVKVTGLKTNKPFIR